MPGLEIFAQDLIERRDGGWRMTEVGRSALDLLERKPATPESQQVQITAPEPSPAVVHPESFIVAGATPAARAAVSVGLTVVLTWSLCLL